MTNNAVSKTIFTLVYVSTKELSLFTQKFSFLIDTVIGTIGQPWLCKIFILDLRLRAARFLSLRGKFPLYPKLATLKVKV